MSYIDWSRIPRWERACPPPRTRTLDIVLACAAAVFPFAMLSLLAAFARNAEAPVTTGLPILGP